jgi:hypothetical protein
VPYSESHNIYLCISIACGKADFTLEVRRTVLNAMSEEVIEFAEVEYRPHQPPLHPRLQTIYTENQESTDKEAIPRKRLYKPYISSPLSGDVQTLV